MRTWKNKEGKWVSEKPENYLIGVDKLGEEVFIGDVIRVTSPYENGLYKVDKHTDSWTLRHASLKKY